MNNKLKNEKGSITLYVLISMVFFIVVVYGVYFNTTNKAQKQNKEIEKIQKQYEKEDINDLYEKTMNQNDTGISNISITLNTNAKSNSVKATITYPTGVEKRKGAYGDNLANAQKNAENSTNSDSITQIIDVSQNGYIFAIAEDRKGNKITKNIEITNIVSKVSNIKYSYSEDSITKGDTTKPSLTWAGEPKSVSYTVTSGTGYASVNKNTGVVTGNAVGNSTVSVTFTNYDNTTVSASKTIKVTYSPYSITNLMTNGSFESDITGWYNTSSTLTKDSSIHRYGSYSMKASCSGQIFPRYNVYEKKSNDVYNHYVYAKTSAYIPSNGSGLTPRMYLIFSASKEGWPGTKTEKTVGGSSTVSTWQDMSIYEKADHSYLLFMLCQSKKNANGNIYFDGITIVDLTATFGNNIPSKEWCDKHINYFDGKSTIYK